MHITLEPTFSRGGVGRLLKRRHSIAQLRWWAQTTGLPMLPDPMLPTPPTSPPPSHLLPAGAPRIVLPEEATLALRSSAGSSQMHATNNVINVMGQMIIQGQQLQTNMMMALVDRMDRQGLLICSARWIIKQTRKTQGRMYRLFMRRRMAYNI